MTIIRWSIFFRLNTAVIKIILLKDLCFSLLLYQFEEQPRNIRHLCMLHVPSQQDLASYGEQHQKDSTMVLHTSNDTKLTMFTGYTVAEASSQSDESRAKMEVDSYLGS